MLHYDPLKARGEEHGSAKLKESDIVDIRELAAGGLTCRELATWYGVHNSTISRIVNKTRWVHVDTRTSRRTHQPPSVP